MLLPVNRRSRSRERNTYVETGSDGGDDPVDVIVCEMHECQFRACERCARKAGCDSH